jgi:glutamate racemase
MPDNRPVGVFDSGVGGLSVLGELVRQLPHEDFLYLADSAHCPYGPRSAEEIRQLSQAISRFLIDQGAKAIVVACNTASAAALTSLRAAFDVPFVGMVPAVKPAAALTASRRVGVLATRATVNGTLFNDVVERFAAGVEVLNQVADGLVERVEAGDVDEPATEALLHRYLDPMLTAGIDTLVLGCTHYPFLIPTIRRIAGPTLVILDPSSAVARQAGRVLAEHGLLAERDRSGQVSYFTTDDPAAFMRVLQQLAGEQRYGMVTAVTKVELSRQKA